MKKLQITAGDAACAAWVLLEFVKNLENETDYVNEFAVSVRNVLNALQQGHVILVQDNNPNGMPDEKM